MSQPRSIDSIKPEFDQFIAGFNSVILSTLSATGQPEASYAPCVQGEKGFYVLLSELAAHTQNLLQQPDLSLFFIEPETQAKNIFARQRASLAAKATPIARNTPTWEAALEQMTQTLGPTVSLIRDLKDFRLFFLEPYQAQFVIGFGQAYRLSGPDLQDVEQMTAK